ncbi:hypothetical protein Hamer_G019488 [Homarus americanus]|uniref:Uncharacterized protein n=1 Tax=Homarus americanus TaxID=6706 RepID=A0A8J5JI60_HOMAM|nr:hypothetical protein Hamer_G019488 [Homarus americanus]
MRGGYCAMTDLAPRPSRPPPHAHIRTLLSTTHITYTRKCSLPPRLHEETRSVDTHKHTPVLQSHAVYP